MNQIIFVAIALALFVANIFANTEVLVSNATYGQMIYVLVYENGSLASGSVKVKTPANKSIALNLTAGQASINASESGLWNIQYGPERHSIYVREYRQENWEGGFASGASLQDDTYQQPKPFPQVYFTAAIASLALFTIFFVYHSFKSISHQAKKSDEPAAKPSKTSPKQARKLKRKTQMLV